MATNRQKFAFAKRGAAAMLAVTLVGGMCPSVALAQEGAEAAPAAVEAKAQEKTPDGYAMEIGKEYEVKATYNANLQSYMDVTAPATVVWDGEKYEITVKKSQANASPVKFIFKDGAYAGEYAQDDATKTITFPVESLTSDTIKFEFNFGLGWNTAAEITLDTSTLPTAPALDHTALEDGTYTATIAAKNCDYILQDSMMNDALGNPATIAVEDGVYSLMFDLKPVKYTDTITGYAYQVKHYPSYKVDEVDYNKVTGEGAPLFVDVVDGTAEQPSTIRYTLSEQEIESGYSVLNMYINGAPMAGDVDALIAIDWDTLEKAADPEPEPGEAHGMEAGQVYDATVSLAGTGDYVGGDVIINQMVGKYFGNSVKVTYNENGTYDVVVYFGGEYNDAIGDMTYNGQAIKQAENQTYTINVPSIDEPIEVGLHVGGKMDMDITYAMTIDTETLAPGEPVPDPEPPVVEVDTEALADAIAKASVIEQGKKTDEAFAALKAAIGIAQTALETAESQEAVNAAVEALNSAVEAFKNSPDVEVPVEIDTAELASLIEAMNKVEQGKKTDEAWATFQNAIDEAEAVLAAPESQGAVDAAVDALNAAFAAFEESPEVPIAPEPGDVDTSDLQTAIDEAASMTQDGKSDAAWKALQDAIDAARAALASATTQDEVNAALDALNAAVEAFSASADDPAYPTDPADPEKPAGQEGDGADDGFKADDGAGTSGDAALAKTGDAAPVAALGAAGVAAGAAAAVAWARRRSQNG